MIKNRMVTEPIPVVRQERMIQARNVTTLDPGKIVPVFAAGLLREDSCSGRLNIAVEVKETYEVLFNNLQVRANFWFVPAVANERFQRNKTFFERSAVGEAITDEEGAETIDFIETHAFGTGGPIYKHLGLSAKADALVSTAYREAYNQLVKYAYRQRSKSLTPPLMTSTALAAAMWGPSSISAIVPDFDEAMIAGETPLTVTAGRMPVKGLAAAANVPFNGSAAGSKQADGSAATGNNWSPMGTNIALQGDATTKVPNLFAEMQQNGITIALANIDQARKLVGMAKLREQREGHTDAYVIENLMAGIPVEDQAWMYPMLIDTQMVDVQQVRRMASDGASLEDGVANGLVRLSLGANIPQNPYGGVMMVTIEAIPKQLFERQADPYFTTVEPEDLPRYDRDFLNPMPVVEVKNKEIDVDHSNPEGRFGYARRNWKWMQDNSRVGGDLYAPNADEATDIERRLIYPTDVANPALNTEFYLSTTLGKDVFLESTRNPIRVGVGGTLTVRGLTIIGEVHESEANYEAVRAEYPPLVPPAGK